MTAPAHDLADYDRFIEFFDQAVMAAYLQQSDRFVVKTDHFEGHLSSRDDGSERDDWIDIRFGYRTLSNGDLAIAIFRPDLYKKSSAHVSRWAGFRLGDPQWATPDERYSLWLRRYFDAEWGVEDGPRAQLEALVATINALAAETVGLALFEPHECEALTFPLTQNTHRYQDAHLVLYGFLIDGLQKECIVRIGAKAGVTLNIASDKTFSALRKVPGVPEGDSPLWAAFEKTSEQRWLAGHKTRPTATRFSAFEEFTEDLKRWVAGLRELLSCLEKILGMKGAVAAKRHTAKQYLPVIVAPPQANYSIATLPRIVGKTVARVESGFRRKHPKLHQSEAMILHFTDGSSLGIETGSNIVNLSDDYEQLDPTEFHVDFILQWVPTPDGSDDDT